LLVSFAMCAAFPRSDYYETSAPFRAIGWQRACPPPGWLPGGKGRPGMVPTFTT